MLQCPACNEFNPADHQFCGYCGHRLPAVPSADDMLPPWLAGDTSTMQPVLTEHTALQPAAEAPADEHLPPWLRTPKPVVPPQSRTSSPPANEPERHTHEQETAPELPFWLNDATTIAPPAASGLNQPKGTSASTAEAATEGANTYALPAWLDTADPTPPPAQAHAAPPTNVPANDADQPHPPAPTSTEKNDDPLPLWLLAADAALSDSGTAAALDSASNTSPRLTDEPLVPPSSSSTPAPEHDDSLSWLLDGHTPSASPATINAAVADELPEWLRDAVNMPQQDLTAPATNELPSWLHDDPASTPSAPPVPPTVQQHAPHTTFPARGNKMESLPAWLRDGGDQPDQELPVSSAQPDVPSSTKVDGATDAVLTTPQETNPPTNELFPPPYDGNVTDGASAAVPVEATSKERTAPAPAARVYEAAPEETFHVAADEAASEPQSIITAAVYDTPLSAPLSEDHIAALIAAPTTPPTSAPADTVAPASTPVDTTSTAATPVAPAPIPAPFTSFVPPQPARRGYGLWIMLAIVLVLALLAVGWLALRFNHIT